MPNYFKNTNNFSFYRTCFKGRLICDTFEIIKNILIKQTNFDLRTICKNYLKVKIPEVLKIEL